MSISCTYTRRLCLTISFITGIQLGLWIEGSVSQAHYDLAAHMRIRGEEIPILSLAQLPRVIDKFMAKYGDYGISALSFDAVGRDLYADYKLKENELVDREQAKAVVMDELSKLKAQNMSLMVSGANAYTLPYADFVVEMPLYSRNFEILDQGVPFYQIVLRGYIPYAGEPGNLTKKPQTYLLKLLETGAVPYYLLSYSESTAVKASRFDDLYAINYLDHSDEIMRVYSEVASVLGPIWNERIIEHESVEVNVYKTTYESGVAVIVNYNSEPVEVAGVDIPAFGYHVLEGGSTWPEEGFLKLVTGSGSFLVDWCSHFRLLLDSPCFSYIRSSSPLSSA